MIGRFTFAAFIDPYFSSGVHLAIAGGLAAAAGICGVIKGEITEQEAANWHTAKVDSSYNRFVLRYSRQHCHFILLFSSQVLACCFERVPTNHTSNSAGPFGEK